MWTILRTVHHGFLTLFSNIVITIIIFNINIVYATEICIYNINWLQITDFPRFKSITMRKWLVLTFLQRPPLLNTHQLVLSFFRYMTHSSLQSDDPMELNPVQISGWINEHVQLNLQNLITASLQLNSSITAPPRSVRIFGGLSDELNFIQRLSWRVMLYNIYFCLYLFIAYNRILENYKYSSSIDQGWQKDFYIITLFFTSYS